MYQIKTIVTQYFICIAICCFFIQSSNASDSDVKKYILYDANLSQQNNLEGSLKGKIYERFSGLIEFLPKKEPSNFLNKKLLFLFDKNLTTASNDWSLLSPGAWLSPPGANMSAFTDIKLAPSQWRLPKSLYGFNEIWIDYQPVDQYQTCQPSIELTGSYQGFGRPVTSKPWKQNSSFFKELDVVKALNFQGNSYVKKNIIYYLRRYFNLLSGSDWYFESGKDGLTIEKRLHEDLKNVDYLDINIASNINVNGIQLFFDDKISGSNGEILSVQSALIGKDPNSDYSTYRFNIRAAIEGRYPDSFHAWKDVTGKQVSVYLQRIVFLVDGDEKVLASNDLFKSANLIGSSHYLPERHWQPNIGGYRQVIGLNNIAEPYRSEVILNQAILRLKSEKFQQCAIKINEISLVKIYQGSVPRYVQTIEDWNHHLGGPQKVSDDLNQGQIEYPENLSYLPINSFFGADLNNQWNGSFLESDSYSKLGATDLSAYVPNGVNLYASDGANLKRTDGKFKITWPIKVNVKKGSKFFIGGLGGVKNKVSLALEITSESGEISELKNVRINQAQDFPEFIGNIRNFQITGDLGENASLPILDVAIFYPGLANYKEALSLKLPTMMGSNSLVGINETQALLGAGEGVIVGDQNSTYIHLRSNFDTPLRSIYGLKVEFILPNSSRSPEGCAFKAYLNFEFGSGRRSICLNINASAKYLTFNELNAGHQNINLGKLISIDWQINKSLFKSKSDLEQFRLNATAFGWGERSALDRITERPVSTIDKTPIYIDKKLFESEIQSIRFDRRMWATLYTSTPLKFDEKIVNIRPTTDQWIALEKLAVEYPLDFSVNGRVINHPHEINSVSLNFLFILMAGSISLLWVIWRNWLVIKRGTSFIAEQMKHKLKEAVFFAKILSIVKAIFLSRKLSIYRIAFFVIVCPPLFYFGINNRLSAMGGWYLSFAELFSACLLRELIIVFRKKLFIHYPVIAIKIYEARGNIEFFGALLIFPVIIVAMLLGLGIASQELASIAYILLVFGVACKFLAQDNSRRGS